MKTLHLSIIVGAGIAIFVISGIYILWIPSVSCPQNYQTGIKMRVDSIEISGLKNSYQSGEPIQVSVIWSGIGNDGIWPNVIINNSNGTEVWHQPDLVHFARADMICNTFRFIPQDSSGYPILNKTGTYTMVASLDNKTASTGFTVVKPLTIYNHNCPPCT